MQPNSVNRLLQKQQQQQQELSWLRLDAVLDELTCYGYAVSSCLIEVLQNFTTYSVDHL